MGTNEKHPHARREQQCKKMLLRACRKKMPHHSRKWWRAWVKTQIWDLTHKVDDTEEGGQE